MVKVKRIMWISRHPPLPKEVEALEKAFGEVQILQYGAKVKDVDHVLHLMEQYKADEVVTILPLTIMMRLCERGVRPLWPECTQVDGDDYDFVDEKTGKKYRFVRFLRVRGVRLDADPL